MNRDDWKIVRLGEVCIINPQKKEVCLNESDYVSFLPMEDLPINANKTSPTQSKTYKEVYKSSYTYFADGDVIVAKVSPCFENGKIGIAHKMINGVGFGTSELNVFRPNKYLISEYLYYSLSTKKFREQGHNHLNGASGLRRLTKDFIHNYQIPLPPLSTQTKIVSELDLLHSVLTKKREQVKELDSLAQSLFYDTFGDPVENEKGWEVKKLEEVVEQMFIGPFGSSLKTDYYVSKEEAFCMVYEQKHAIKKSLAQETHYINKEKFEQLKRFEVHTGDFIMSCRGTIGEIYRLPSDAPIGIIHPSLMKIRISESSLNPNYFMFLLDKIVKESDTNGGCVQMAITAKELSAKIVPLPPLPLQQTFAEKIKKIESQKETIKASIKEVQTMIDEAMERYFG